MMKLSPLQLYMMKRLAAGDRQKQIFPKRTRWAVTDHCRRVREKLGARTTLQAAVMLARTGVI